MIRKVLLSDSEEICRIYNYYIQNSISTFEVSPVTVKEMEKRIKTTTVKYPWIVIEREGAIRGYAYATEWKPRPAYRFTTESSVYIDQDWTGRGLGNRLYSELMGLLRKYGFRTALGGIALPNEASIALHEKHGFKNAGQLNRVGHKFGHWINVGYWQIEFEMYAIK